MIQDPLLRVICGDALVELGKLPESSIDCCITDPPYGIGFMGQKWDTFKPGSETKRVKARTSGDTNPNVIGRKRSPATSPASVPYDRSLGGQIAFQQWCQSWAREVLRVLKPGGHLLVCGAPRGYHRMACGVENAGFEIRDCLMWVFGQGFPKSRNLDGDFHGWGTALKPGWEPIILCRKPLAGTVAENMARNGTGALNIDACRIEGEKGNGVWGSSNKSVNPKRTFVASPDAKDYRSEAHPKGRWPANVVHDGSEEVLAEFAKAGTNKGAAAPVTRRGSDKFRSCYGEFAGQDEPGATFQGDSGSAARFFYCAKASRSDRDDGQIGEKKDLNWSSGDKSPGTFQSENTDRAVRNFHPTVKPTALMQWLVRLVCQPNGIVLDCFAGSGTTGRAALIEGRRSILIERESQYCEMAKRRCNVTPGLALA